MCIYQLKSTLENLLHLWMYLRSGCKAVVNNLTPIRLGGGGGGGAEVCLGVGAGGGQGKLQSALQLRV